MLNFGQDTPFPQKMIKMCFQNSSLQFSQKILLFSKKLFYTKIFSI